MTGPASWPRATARAAGLLIAWIGLTLAGWGAGALTITATRAADLHAVRDLASDRTTALTAAAHALSFIGSGYLVIPLAALVAILVGIRGERRAAAAIALSVAGAIALSSLIKVLVDRTRPPVHHLEAVSSASFPSGHATQSTACFVALLLAWLAMRRPARGRTAAITATALLIAAISMSRVYLGVHYPTDVAAGILLGGAWTLLSRRALCPTPEPAGR